jgi:hypothetical protein
MSVMASALAGCSGNPVASDADVVIDVVSDVTADSQSDIPYDTAADTLSDIAEEVAPDVIQNPVSANIVPFVRIEASDTLHEAFPWPIESEDAPATIRDENPGTSWKIPATEVGSEGVVLTLDIQPWLGRGVELQTLKLQVTGDVGRVWVDMLDACGGTRSASVDLWSDLSAELDLTGHSAGCIQIHFQANGNAALDALEIMALVPAAAVPDTSLPPGDLPDQNWASSGVIEGFYGVPWSWTERNRMVDLLARTGLGAYLYCPKWDPKHRAFWREPYSQAELDGFKGLIDHANAWHVSFSFGISPFIDFNATTEDDYEILKAKIIPFVEMGAGSVTLLADDIEFDTDNPIDAVMGAIHVDVVNRMLDDLRVVNPDLVMAFVPTVYSDERILMFEDGAAYLQELSQLDPDIQIMWTGPNTSDLTMSAADMDDFRAITGRKPLIWENFWANDGGDGFLGRMLLGAFSGRSPDLVGAVSGIMHNPSKQGAAMRLTVATFAQFMHDAATYDTTATVDYATQIETTSGAGYRSDSDINRQAAALVMKLFDGNAQLTPGHRDMMARIDSLIEKIEGESGDYAADVAYLLPIFGAMASIQSLVYHSTLAADLVDDLVYPLLKVRHEGEAGLAVLAALADKASGRSGATPVADGEAAIWESNLCRFMFSDSKVEELLKAVKTMPLTGSGFAKAVVKSPEGACIPGKLLTWKPVSDELVADGAVITVSGLPGAEVVDGTISWRPSHSGTYRMSVTAFGSGQPAYVGYMFADVVCTFPTTSNQ